MIMQVMNRGALRMILVLTGVVACADPVDPPVTPPPRELQLEATIDASGLSEPLAFEIPETTRSVTIVAQGAPDALLALGGFALGDGADLVQLPNEPPGAAMQASYRDEQSGDMPGALYQSIRLGTFAHAYPYKPGQTVLAGTGFVRLASSPRDKGSHSRAARCSSRRDNNGGVSKSSPTEVRAAAVERKTIPFGFAPTEIVATTVCDATSITVTVFAVWFEINSRDRSRRRS